MTTTVPLREVAHVRAGEKGDLVNLAVVPYREDDFDLVRDQVTAELVGDTFGAIVTGDVIVYSVPGSHSLNVVMDGALDGGRSRNIVFDESGKALSGLALTIPLRVPAGFVPWSVEQAARGGGGSPQEPAEPPRSGGVRLGCATGWARDRFEPAEVLLRHGRLDYLCFETMSEVTMSAAQVARRRDPSLPGYDPYLLERVLPVMALARRSGVRIVTNQGWTDPSTAADVLAAALRDRGIRGVRIAAVVGGDLSGVIGTSELSFEGGGAIADHVDAIVSAEVYLGADEIAHALAEGADVVITPRVTDASLFVGPLMHEFGWSSTAWDELAMAVTVGHLVECGAQVTGGYFADPGYKDVVGLEDIGYPVAQVHADGFYLTKPPGTGGVVSPATCKEQLLYEVGDPSAYLNPDVSTDLTGVRFRPVGRDVVEVSGFRGDAPPERLKALIGLEEGWVCEQFVLYAGPGAHERASMAEHVLRERLGRSGVDASRLRFDRIGVDAVHREATPRPRGEPYEVVLRIAMRGDTRADVDLLRREVDPMAATGPAGTGKWAPMGDLSRPVVGLRSALVPRDLVSAEVSFVES